MEAAAAMLLSMLELTIMARLYSERMPASFKVIFYRELRKRSS
jgi:hypothetical protein